MSDQNNDQSAPPTDTRQMAAALWDKMQSPPGDQKAGEQKAPDPKPGEQKAGEQKQTEVKTPVLPKFVKTAGEQKAPDPKPGDQKQPEPPDFDKIVGPDEKSKHRPDWDKMKAAASEQFKARQAAEARIAELEKKLQSSGDPVANEATKARIAELEGRVKDYDAKLKVFDLQSHPDFVRQYVEPERKAATDLANLFKMEGVDDVDVSKLLALDGKKFAEAVSAALEGLTPFSRTTATQLFHQAKIAQQSRSEALSKTDELREQYRQNQLARARAAFDEVGKVYSETLIPMQVAENAPAEEVAAAEQYNAALRQVGTVAEKLAFGATDERTVSDMAHKAARFDFIVNHALPRFEAAAAQELAKSMSRIAELEAQVKELTAHTPKYSGAGGDGGAGGGGDGPRPGESTEAYARRLATASGLFKA